MASIEDLKRQALQGDEESQYLLGMEYMGRGDYVNAVEWLEKIVAKLAHSRYGKAVSNLAQIHEVGGHPRYSRDQSRDEAIRLFKIIADNPVSVISRLHLGLLYCEGEGAKHNPVEGKRLIERSVQEIIDEMKNDEYLKQVECYRIGIAYFLGLTNAGNSVSNDDLRKAMDYLGKTVDRCDDRYESDRDLKHKAFKAYKEAQGRLL